MSKQIFFSSIIIIVAERYEYLFNKKGDNLKYVSFIKLILIVRQDEQQRIFRREKDFEFLVEMFSMLMHWYNNQYRMEYTY